MGGEQADEGADERAQEGSEDWAHEALERELYWAQERSARGPAIHTLAELRDALQDFEALLAADERSMYPRAEPYLAAGDRYRRAVKIRQWRLMRPITRRYDRLIGELAALTLSLAERLRETRGEVAQLREELDKRMGDEP